MCLSKSLLNRSNNIYLGGTVSQISSVAIFPYEIELAIYGLNHENRRNILTTLIQNGKLSFSEILEKTSIPRSLLANHLNILVKSLLIEHFYEHELGVDRFSYYHLSDYGKRILECLNNALYVVKKETTTIQIIIKHEKEATTISGDEVHSFEEEVFASENTSYEISSLLQNLRAREERIDNE